jgi:curli biogenesis system outer membrane secretion channel CsgG
MASNYLRAGVALALSTALAQPAAAQWAKPSKGQQMQQQAANDVPHCSRKLGTVSIENGDDPSAWTQASLAPPAKLLKVLVQRSGCFNIVDRGTGLNAAQRERAIGGGLGLQRRSNVGMGQIKAADYVLIAEIGGANSNVSGSGIAGGVGGLIDHRVGALLGGLKSKKMEANTVLSLTNVRTTETIATEEGYAAKNNLSFGVGGFFAVAGAVGGGYDNTDIGRIVTLSFIQAYSKMVTNLGLLQPGSEGTAEAAPSRTYTAQGPVAMRATASAKGRLIRTLPAGSAVYLTGKKAGLWWEVSDENDNTGWVLNTRLAPSQAGID